MITLITGQPGMGKTAMMVQILEKVSKDRPVYVFGIPELDKQAIPHFPMPPLDHWTKPQFNEEIGKDVYKFAFPPNSIFVIDEAQDIYGTRLSGSKVPPHVSALATHRHTGIDIYLLTQGAHMLDSYVRALIGKHIDIRPTLFGKYSFEWAHVGEPNSKTSRSEAVKRKYSPPKSSFGKYKSAELHTKPQFKINWLIPFAVLLIAYTVYNGYSMYKKFSEKTNSEPISSEITQGVLPSINHEVITPAIENTIQPDNIQNMGYVQAHTPEIPSLPHTAPIYKQATIPENVPYPAICIMSKSKGCKCYTDQATFINTDEDVCKQIVANGFFMDWNKKNESTRSVANNGVIRGVAPDDGFAVSPNSQGISSRSSPSDSL